VAFPSACVLLAAGFDASDELAPSGALATGVLFAESIYLCQH